MGLILETPRLLVREFTVDDAEAFFVLCSDPEVLRWTGDPGVASVDEARASLLARPIADYAKHGFGRWACIDRATGALIGFTGPKYLDELGEIDIGYRLLPAWWGRGLATEATGAACDYCFARLGLTRLLGLVDPDNVRSVRVLEKLGFAAQGWIDYLGKQVLSYLRAAPCPEAGPTRGHTDHTRRTRNPVSSRNRVS
jgi:ribosomal-protein-alanine N-acetyltransferase